MTTPILIIAILTVPLLIFYLAGKWGHDRQPSRFGGVAGLSLAFAFFGVGHFVMTDAMMEMLPPWVPQREPLIYATGILEFALAAALLVRRSRRAVGWICLAVLIAFFPANIYAAIQHTGPGGHEWGPEYLLIRAPLQALLIAWTWWFVLRRAPVTGAVSGPARPGPAG